MTSYGIDQERSGLAEFAFETSDLVPTIGATMRAGWLPTKMPRDFMEIVCLKTATNTRMPALRKVG